MTDEKWEELVDLAKKHFKDVEVSTEDLVTDTPDGPQVQGTRDILIFEREGQRYKAVRENKPVVLEKKMLYSHRQGDTAHAEYKLSDTEFSHRIRVYKEVDFDEWQEISGESLGL